jgi:hypothetical protein
VVFSNSDCFRFFAFAAFRRCNCSMVPEIPRDDVRFTEKRAKTKNTR